MFARKRFTMETLQSRLPLIIMLAPENCIVNRQIGVKVSKFLVLSGPYLQVTWHSACAMAIFVNKKRFPMGCYRV